MMYRARGYAVLCYDELKNLMRHAALTCAVLYLHCGSSRPWHQNPGRMSRPWRQILTELIWILSLSCLNA